MDTINRLQFRHHEEIFETREDALKYICKTLPREGGEGLAEPGSPYTRSLFAEPTILRYKNTEEDGTCNDGCSKGPHIIIVIGSQTNDDDRKPEENKYCIIDIDKTEDEIKNLEEELEKAIKSLTIIALNSDTLNLYAEKTEDGTLVSGDVKTAETHVFDGLVKENNLMIVPTDDLAGPAGLFIYVDLTYDEATETFTFIVTNADGTLKKQAVKLPSNYLVSGEYKKEDESIHLHMKNGDDILINCEQLIDEWKVEGEASTTPIVLNRTNVGPDDEQHTEHHHTEPWQDILRADVRVADFINTNILEKTTDGRYLYVDGKATNIVYYYNGEKSNVSEQLDKLNKIKISADNDNIIWNRTDGFFASAKLDYISNKNKLVFTTSTVSGGTITKEIQLNSVELFQNVYYDRNTEELVITYKDNEGNLKVIRIPISDMFDEWDVLNDAHSVKLVKSPHHVSGKDILTADVNISSMENNILEEIGEGNVHALFVKGTSDNIKYNDTTVESALDDLAAEDAAINEKIDQEISRSTEEDEKIENTIGSGFSTDAHETVTYKFNQLQEEVNSEAEKLQNEIDRSTAKDDEHDAKLAEQQAEIEAISADSANNIKDIINNDHSIDVDKTDQVRPVISVNLSDHEPYNIIRLEGDGLYSFIDLGYDSDTNKLIFTRSDKDSRENKTKEIQLNSVPFDIRYDKDREVLIITYHTSEGEKTVEIDLHDLIHDEWTVQDTETVTLNKSVVVSGGPDVLTAKVKICHHEDNAIEEHNDGIYVHSYSGEIADLGSKIDTVSGDVITEKARAEAADDELDRKINAEASARSEADDDIYIKIREFSGDTSLELRSIRGDVSRISGDVSSLESDLDDEIERAKNAESGLTEAIRKAKIKFSPSKDGLVSDGTIEFNNYEANNNIVEAKVMLQDGTNIIKVGNGLYATVDLGYSAATNTLELITSSGSKTIPLAGVTFIDRCYYDSVNKNIVIVYKDGQGIEHTTTIGVTDLFNEWDVNNATSVGAIHLVKETATSGGTDKLSAYVLLDDEIIDPNTGIPTGIMQEGTPNAIRKIGNGLFVKDNTENIECISGRTDAIYKAAFGELVPSGCGEAIEYIPDTLSCVISGATSLYDADRLMAHQICEILEMWVSGMTCTSVSNWVDDGANKKMLVDVRPSHGNLMNGMTDDDLYITDLTGDTIEHGVTEFTDTNALRIVCLEEGGGVIPDISSPQNGIYLSNVWDCGKYYQESTEADEMEEVSGDGYNVNYFTDEDTSARNFNYMNNVR